MTEVNAESNSLHENNANADPIEQFREWFGRAKETDMKLPHAMTLATCGSDGKPSARMVLMHGFDERGFVFYTNYESRKSKELLQNPHAALVFYWEQLDRQVRVEGPVEKITPEESDAYFKTRPRGSQVGAWASPQSEVLRDRQDLESRAEKTLAKFGEEDPIPRPPFWGGFRVVPQCIEFWQSRPDRLHDRLRYEREGQTWKIQRLAP